MEKDIGLLVRVTSNQLDREFERFGATLGLTGVQVLIIDFVYSMYEIRDLFQKDIEKEFNIRRSTATNILKLMEKTELIKRVSIAEDARLKKIILTDKSLKLQQQISDYKKLIEAHITSKVTPEELQVFRHVINQVIESLK